MKDINIQEPKNIKKDYMDFVSFLGKQVASLKRKLHFLNHTTIAFLLGGLLSMLMRMDLLISAGFILISFISYLLFKYTSKKIGMTIMHIECTKAEIMNM